MVRSPTRAIVLGVALLAIPIASRSQELSATHREKIETLMELTGAQDIGNQMGKLVVEQMYAAFRKANPNLPDDAFSILQAVTFELIDEESGKLLQRCIPIYAKYFSESEISDLVAFYQTPTGRKATRVLPSIMQELVPISQAWALGLQPEMERRIRARLSEAGYL